MCCRHARAPFPDVPIHAVMGGLHLSGAERGDHPADGRGVGEFDLKMIAAGHCTGWRAMTALLNAFGERAGADRGRQTVHVLMRLACRHEPAASGRPRDPLSYLQIIGGRTHEAIAARRNIDRSCAGRARAAGSVAGAARAGEAHRARQGRGAGRELRCHYRDGRDCARLQGRPAQRIPARCRRRCWRASSGS